MRTTLTLDDDVAALLRRYQRARKLTFKDALNEALRKGLIELDAPARRPRSYRMRPVSLGRCKLPSLANVSEVLALTEGEAHK